MQLYKILRQIIRIFWLISRLFLGLIFAYCAYFVLDAPETSDFIVAGFFVAFASALLWIFFAELFKRGANKWIKIFTGSVSIIMAAIMVFITLETFDFLDSYQIILGILCFSFTGIIDFLSIRKNNWKLKTRRLVIKGE